MRNDVFEKYAPWLKTVDKKPSLPKQDAAPAQPKTLAKRPSVQQPPASLPRTPGVRPPRGQSLPSVPVMTPIPLQRPSTPVVPRTPGKSTPNAEHVLYARPTRVPKKPTPAEERPQYHVKEMYAQLLALDTKKEGEQTPAGLEGITDLSDTVIYDVNPIFLVPLSTCNFFVMLSEFFFHRLFRFNSAVLGKTAAPRIISSFIRNVSLLSAGLFPGSFEFLVF